MRVLMLSKACIVGIYQRKLESIARQGVELLALVPPAWRDERGTQPLERVYTQGYRLESIPVWWNGNFHLHLYPTLGRWLRQFRPDVVHIDEEPYNVATWHALALARRQGARALCFTWQNIHRQYPPPFAWGEQWVLRHIDYVLAGTDSAGAVCRAKGYRGPLATIPQFGTDPDLFQPQPQPQPRPFTIGYMGRLVPEKGIALLLEAAAGLPGDWHLRLVGGGPLRSALAQQAARLGIAPRVEFVGQVASTAMPAQMAALDVLVLPSLTRPNWKEQFGRVLVEAMAAGVPVIGSDSGAIPGVIGAGGLIVPEGDAAALRQALLCLLQQPAERQRLGRLGRARVLAHFTHDSIASATVQVYQALLHPPAAG
ncbi:MAG: glycosyltransferase family 4 protein [Anaerolineae bacterium]|nr:glycosyltransferase family 4 protein [Anaerolineae bacterium]